MQGHHTGARIRQFSALQRHNRKEKYPWRPRRLHAAVARSRRPLRPPDPPLEPEDGAVHLRRAQRHPHHRPVADGAAAARALEGARRSPPAAGSCSSAPSARRRSRSPRRRAAAPSTTSTTAGWAARSPTGRPCRSSITRLRELEEQLAGDTAGLTKKELLQLDPRARQARAVAGRHQGHGRHPRPDVRDRHQQGSDRDPGSQRSSASR